MRRPIFFSSDSRNLPSRRTLLQAAAVAAALYPRPGGAAGRNVRIGIIGLGGRGTGVLKTSLTMGSVEVSALCDIKPEATARGADLVESHGGAKPALYTAGPMDYKPLLQRDDVEAVFLTAPAVLHGPMAIDSLRANKWVFSEVPACHSIEEGWQLVRAAEESSGHYFLVENYCFSRNNLMALRMVEEGLLGTPTFAECGYIHNTRDLQFNAGGSLTWRGEENGDPGMIGNTYPTHPLGPASQALGITRGDRFTTCVSMMTPARGFHNYAVKQFGPDSAPARIDTWNGDNSLTLIQTESGAVVYPRFDNASPRPHRMGFYTLQGTKGSVDDERGVYVDRKSAAKLRLRRRVCTVSEAWGSAVRAVSFSRKSDRTNSCGPARMTSSRPKRVPPRTFMQTRIPVSGVILIPDRGGQPPKLVK